MKSQREQGKEPGSAAGRNSTERTSAKYGSRAGSVLIPKLELPASLLLNSFELSECGRINSKSARATGLARE